MSTFSVVTNYSTTLSSPMSSGQLTVPVNSIVTRDSTPATLTNAMIGDGWYLTIDPGTNSEEIVKVTAVAPGTGNAGIFTVAALGRGLAYSGATDAQIAGNAKAHNPGAVVILSDAKNLWNKLVDVESDQTINGVKTFTDSPLVPTPTSLEVNAAASVQYVNDIATAGAPNAAVGVKGIVEIGTQAQVNTGDDSGSTDADSVVIPSTHLQTWDLLVTTDYTYGATISAGAVLYLDTATAKWKLASAAVLATCDGTLGIALDAGVDTNTGKRVQIGGVATGLSGLTAGWVYVSNSNGQYSATAGTVKKVVGYAANATTLVMLDAIAADQLTGGSADLTAAALNRAGTFFTTPLKQGIKTLVTAGQDLNAGDIVAIESDGKAYRTRPTNFSTANAGASTALAATEYGTKGQMYFYDSATPTIKTFLGDEHNAGNSIIEARRVTVDGDFNAVSSTAADSANFTDSINTRDTVLFHTDKIATAANGASTLRVACCQDVTGTPAFGAVVSIDTTVDGAGISDTSVTDTLVAFSSDASQIKSYKITNSGNTLTESTNSTFLSGTNLTPLCAKRFTGTDYIAVAYYSADDNKVKVNIGQFTPSTGVWVSVGSAVTLASSGITASAQVVMEQISSTKMAVCFTQNTNGNLNAVVLTRSGTTPTIGAILTEVPGGALNCITFKQLGVASYFMGGDGNAGGKLWIVAMDAGQTAFSLVGSALTNGAAGDRGIAGCLLYPGRWLAMAQDAATTCAVNTRQLTVNLDSAIGVIEAATVSAATGNAVTSGYVASLSGLTAGTGYYTGIDGQPTAYSYGAAPFLDNASGAPLVRRAYSALSATEGIVSLS